MSKNVDGFDLSVAGPRLSSEAQDYLRRRAMAGCSFDNIDQVDVAPVSPAQRLGSALTRLGLDIGMVWNPRRDAPPVTPGEPSLPPQVEV